MKLREVTLEDIGGASKGENSSNANDAFEKLRKANARRRRPPGGRPPLSGATRPSIIVEANETPRIVAELEDALLASGLPLYQRAGLLVSPGFSRLPTWDGKTVTALAISECTAHALVEAGERVADFVEIVTVKDKETGETNEVPVRIGMSLKYATTLKAHNYALRFPVLNGLASCPSISVSGELLDRPGYDRAGVLYDPLGVAFPTVPAHSTKSDVARALTNVLRLLETFDPDFVAPEDKGVAFSMFLTAIARRGLDHAPLHGLDAPVAGSGKSMIVEIASILLTGHGAVCMSQGSTTEEFEKRLGAVLLRGDSMVTIDNIEQPLEGETLNSALTQGTVSIRILGKSESPSVRSSAFYTATGNNLQPKGDLVRRCPVGRLDPRCPRPELRPYDFDPLAYAYENRPQLVCDILTLLKAYHCAGRPNCPDPLQSFVHWSNTVRGCICWLATEFPDKKLGDPVKTLQRVRGADPVLGGLQAALSAIYAKYASNPFTTAELTREAEDIDLNLLILPAGTTAKWPNAGPQYNRIPKNADLRDALLTVAGRSGRVDARALGAWLGKHVDRMVIIDRQTTLSLWKGGLIHGHQQWQIVKK